MNYLKQGEALSPLLFNLVVGYAVRRVQENKNALKVNGTLQLLFCAGDVNVLGRSVRSIKKYTETLFISR
jgi:hypothetical protein